jgi:RimJ/RimL family protein N-acetyltransferase
MITLRPLTSGDVDAICALLSDDRVIRYMLFPKFDRDRAYRFCRRFQVTTPVGDPPQVVFAIAENRDAPVIGLCGLVLDGAQRQGEAWYLVAPEHWGKGIATSAVKDLIAHGFQHLHLHRIWASCVPENLPSSRVLERNHFRKEGRHTKNLMIRGEWRDSETFAVLASEWIGWQRHSSSDHDRATSM